MNENVKRYIPLILTLTAILLLLLGLIYLVNTYQDISKPLKQHEKHMEKFVKNNYNMDEIDSFNLFIDEKSYEIAIGDIKDTKMIIFNPIKNNEKKKAIEYKFTDFINIEQIESDWNERCDNCKLNKSNIAMLDEEPVWEFTYKDEQGRYILEYVSLLDGEVYETLKLQK